METEKRAERVIETLTGPWEKRVLPRMALALPPRVNSDHLTVLGIFAGFVIFTGFMLLRSSRWWIMLSNAGFVLHWWADSLDGTLARVRHREREKFGYFVDHVCDAFTVTLISVGLALSPLVHLGVGLSVAMGYLLMNVYAHIEAYV
ncbi:MAG: CDP-alcohol phosphatidyltransferase family protein, partial [Candidatus Aminicenantales bacterium]